MITHVPRNIPKSPTRPEQLRKWIDGPELDNWSRNFKGPLMDNASKALRQTGIQLDLIDQDMQKLSELKRHEFLTTDELAAEELRLILLRERSVATLEKLVNIHGKLNHLGDSILLAALTNPGKVQTDSEDSKPQMIDDNPRRSLRQIRAATATVVECPDVCSLTD